jgi:release factor glutamine methyltransferase
MPVAGREYDVIVANPPYVPSQRTRPSRHRRNRSWDAGPQGRSLLDRLCAEAPALLAPGGTMLLVHSTVCGVDTTLGQLRRAGLTTSVVARRFEQFGPVMRRRREYLQASGLAQLHQLHEELVVIRADQPFPAPR